MYRSARFTPAARTRMRIWPGPGVGTASSRTSHSGPTPPTRALMVPLTVPPITCLLTNKLRYRGVPRQGWSSVFLRGRAREKAKQHLAEHRQGRLHEREFGGGGDGVADVGARSGRGEPYLSGVTGKGSTGQGLVAEQVRSLESHDFLEDVQARAWRRNTPYGPNTVGVCCAEPVHRHRDAGTPLTHPDVVAQLVPHGFDRCGDGGFRCDVHWATVEVDPYSRACVEAGESGASDRAWASASGPTPGPGGGCRVDDRLADVERCGRARIRFVRRWVSPSETLTGSGRRLGRPGAEGNSRRISAETVWT